MTGLLETLNGNLAATAFGGVGLLCQLTWPLLRQRRSILTVQMGIGTNYGIQYALLDAWSGAGIAGLGATQTLIALMAGDRPWLKKMGLVFLPIVALVSFMTWSGVSSLLALTACSLVMLGRLQQSTVALRLFLLAAAPFGISYDVSVGAMVALCGAVTSAMIAAFMLARELKARGHRLGDRRRSLAVAPPQMLSQRPASLFDCHRPSRPLHQV